LTIKAVELGGSDWAAILPPVNRTAIFSVWLACVLCAFLLGRITAPPDPGEARSAALASSPVAQAPAGASPPPRSAAIPQAAPDLLEQARSLADQGRPTAGIELLESHLAEQGFDAQALFLLADLLQMTGAVEQALDPLLEILRFPPDPEIRQQARRRLDLLINAREQQLINAADLAGLVAYFERLVAAEPAWDGHRLKLARWLLRSGDLEAAAELIRQTGLTGVTEAELEALERELVLADSPLTVERVGGAMYTTATVGGVRGTRPLRLLVDTGATMSGLAVARLEALGARRVEDGVAVHTANGIARLPVYRIRFLELGQVRFEDMAVLGFDDLPRGAEGLLGMDVLGQLSGGGPAAVGRP
jgi:tetratricopeptide (TPR) repeat protein